MVVLVSIVMNYMCELMMRRLVIARVILRLLMYLNRLRV